MTQNKRNKLLSYLNIILITILLMGCKPKLYSEIFLRDIFDVAETGESLTVPAQMIIPISNVDNCEQDNAKIMSVLEKYTVIKFKNCEELSGQMYDVMNVDIETEVIRVDKDNPKIKGLFAIGVRKGDGLEVFSILSPNVDLAVKEIDDRFIMTNVSLDELAVKVKISNDTRKNQKISVDSAFVDGQPVDLPHTFELKRRDGLEIVPSDVRLRSMVKNKSAPILKIL